MSSSICDDAALCLEQSDEIGSGVPRCRLFSRNVCAIEVLVDQNAIVSGAAAEGAPWRYYDLGHGW